MHNDIRQSTGDLAREPRRRNLLLAIPAMLATIGLSAACSQASTPATKSQAEQAPSKPAEAKPADPKPAAAAPAAAKVAVKSYPAAPAMSIDPNKKYTALIKTTLGEMTAELYPKDAPNTVNNFVFLS